MRIEQHVATCERKKRLPRQWWRSVCTCGLMPPPKLISKTLPWLRPLAAVAAGAGAAAVCVSAYRRHVESLEEEARQVYESALRAGRRQAEGADGLGVEEASGDLQRVSLDGHEENASTPDFFASTKCVAGGREGVPGDLAGTRPALYGAARASPRLARRFFACLELEESQELFEVRCGRQGAVSAASVPAR